MRSPATAWAFSVLAVAGSGLGLAAAPAVRDLPSPTNSAPVSGWVLADLDGDQSVDLATASTGSHDANGYTQEVRISLGAFRQTSFYFQSRGAVVELSALDVDGDQDGDLVVFEPLSTQPIGVWLNDGAGSFHEGRLADFQKLWSDRLGAAWRGSTQQFALLAISEERTQSLMPAEALGEPQISLALCTQPPLHRRDAYRFNFHPRAPPSKS